MSVSNHICLFHLPEKSVSAEVATAADSSALTMVNMQHTSRAVAAASDRTTLQEHIEENQEWVVSTMCTHLQISPNDLLTDDIKTHPEFMKVLTTVAVSINQYYELVSTWKGKQSFVKRKSKVHTVGDFKNIGNFKSKLEG